MSVKFVVAKPSSQTLRVLCRLCEAKENAATLSSQMLQGLRELCEALNSNECEIRGCEAFVSNAPRLTLICEALSSKKKFHSAQF